MIQAFKCKQIVTLAIMNESSIILWINCKQLSSIIVEDEINRLFTI